MNFIIAGASLTRLEKLAKKYKEGLYSELIFLAEKVFQVGLGIMEAENTKHIHAITEKIKYVQKNWQIMDDAEMAEKLGLAVQTVKEYRSRLGLSHHNHKLTHTIDSLKGVSDAASNGNDHFFSVKDKKKIRARLDRTDETLAQEFKTSPVHIQRCRLELLAEYLPDHCATEGDAVLCKKFGVSIAVIGRIRRTLGLKRKRGRQDTRGKNPFFKKIGTAEEVRYALQEGGLTFPELMRSKGIAFTRQRSFQLLAEYGLTSEREHRKPIWHARRMVGSDREELAQRLVDIDWTKGRLKDLCFINAFASEIGVEHYVLKKYLDTLGVTIPDIHPRTEMVKLSCSQCGKDIFRPQWLIDREKKKYPDKKTWFCTRKCQGAHMGIHFGGRRGTRPVAETEAKEA
jgi:hypothetical protein